MKIPSRKIVLFAGKIFHQQDDVSFNAEILPHIKVSDQFYKTLLNFPKQ